MNIQDWFPLGLTGLISSQSKELSRVFSNTTVQQHQFFDAHSAFFMVQLSHPYSTIGKTMALTIWTFVGKIMSLLFNITQVTSISQFKGLELENSSVLGAKAYINDCREWFIKRSYQEIILRVLEQRHLGQQPASVQVSSKLTLLSGSFETEWLLFSGYCRKIALCFSFWKN